MTCYPVWMTPWLVKVNRNGVWRVVARCISADLAHAVADHLLVQDNIESIVVRSDGPRFVKVGG